MTSETKRAWTEIVTPEDLDQHLLNNGQAQANAEIVSMMLKKFSPRPGSKVIVPGAGTGQLLDFCDTKVFEEFDFTLAEINQSFLSRLTDRISKIPSLKARAVWDDLEDSKLSGPFGAALIVLLLEHIDWKKGLRQILKYGSSQIFLIIQRNETGQPAITPKKNLLPSIKKFSEIATVNLVDADELSRWLSEKGFEKIWSYERSVPDLKTMVGVVFKKS